MYEFLTNFQPLATAEEIIYSLKKIAAAIEQGYDGGNTPIGEWAIVEQAYDDED